MLPGTAGHAVRTHTLRLVLLMGCLLGATVQAAERDDVPIAFVQPGGMPPQPARPALSPSDIARLADRWVTLLDAGDPALAGGAIDLLEQAPGPLADAIAERLARTNALNRLTASAPPALKDRITNSFAINAARLRGYATATLEAELTSAVATANNNIVAALTASAGGYRSVPPRLVDIILSGLENPRVLDQGRDGLAAILLAHPQDARHARARMLRWAGQAPASALARQNRETALIVLLSLNEPLDDAVLAEALGSENIALKRAAIAHLRRPAKALSDTLKARLAALLAHEQIDEDWRGLRDVLRQHAPQVLDDLYASIPAASLARQWPAEITADWVRHAPAAQVAALSELPLDLYTPSARDTPRGCAVIRYQVAILGAQATRGQPTLADFWRTVVKSHHACREPLGADLDDYLARAASTEPAAQVLGKLAGDGVFQLADWRTGSARLASALAPAAAAAVIANDTAKTRGFITGWIAPAAAALDGAGYWSRPVPTDPNAAEIHFRVLQAIRAGPPAAYELAARTAGSEQNEAGVRGAALLALASGNKVAAQLDLFLDVLLADTSVAQTSARLLSRAFDEHQVPPGMARTRKRAFFVDVLTRPAMHADTYGLLARLAREDASAAGLLAEVGWTGEPSATCFLLGAGGAFSTGAGIRALSVAAENPELRDRLRACVALFTTPASAASFLAYHWSQIADREDKRAALKTLQSLWDHPDANDALRARIADVVSTAAAEQPWTPAGQAVLSWWRDRAATAHHPAAATLGTEYDKRRYAGYVLAVPSAIAIHLLLWALLLTWYPQSPSLQAIVFWNPKVRKLLGAGYIDFVLQYVPVARRRLFAPFASVFLQEICHPGDTAQDTQGYFDDSFVQRKTGQGVVQREAPVRIMAALHAHRGRVLLQGKSGLGKSRFLRYSLALRAAQRKDVIVYLRADQCRHGVETEVERRMQGIGSDAKLLRSMIYSGRIYVYIDGYNEVDLEVQEQITAFVADHPHGNIMVTSQIPLRGLSTIDTFELLALNRDQIRAFLGSRTSILPDDAAVRGDTFGALAHAFLSDIWARHAGEAETRAMEDILANPMDLTSVALLLSQGRTPDLFSLESQQLDAVKRRMRAQDMEFRIMGFSKALLEQRLKDQENLQALPFAPEVTELISAKLAQVRTFSDPGMKTTVQEVRFRHDRIRDFFSHFSMLEMTPEQQAGYAADARFAGVFPYLARSMPSGSAERLREHLVSLAAEIEDHRVSDSFVREYSWRQRFAAQDPDWMLAYDATPIRAADEHYAILAQQRSQLDRELLRLREVIAAGRRHTRLITTADNAELVQLGREVLSACGAVENAVQLPLGLTLRSPDQLRFVLLAISQREQIRPFHVELLVARLRRATERVLVIVNSQVALEPAQRQSDADIRRLLLQAPVPVAVLQSTHLYLMYKDWTDGGAAGEVWTELRGQWAAPDGQRDVQASASGRQDRSVV